MGRDEISMGWDEMTCGGMGWEHGMGWDEVG